MKLLKMRFKIVRQMSKYKKKNNMPVQDRAREIQIVKKRMRRGLNKKFVSDFYKLLFKESRRIQR
jgi:chorismate mutase